MMDKDNYEIIEMGEDFITFEIRKFSTIEPIYFASDGVDIGVEKGGYQNLVIHHVPINSDRDKVMIKIQVIR